jgi:hypothetical protein
MCILYRSERKKILLSQLSVISKMAQVLKQVEKIFTDLTKNPEQHQAAYTELIMEETPEEVESKAILEAS